RLGLRGVQRALPRAVVALDREVAALVPDEAGQRVPGLPGEVDAVVPTGVELRGVGDPLVAGLRRGGEARLGEQVLVVDHHAVRRIPRNAELLAVDLPRVRQAGDPVGALEVGDLAAQVLHTPAGRVLGDLGVADLHHVRGVLAGQGAGDLLPDAVPLLD